MVKRPDAVISVRSSQLERHVDVGKLVLDRFEGPYRPPERKPLLGIIDSHRQRRLRPTDLLERGDDRAPIQQFIGAAAAKRLGPGTLEGQANARADDVQALERVARNLRLGEIDS